MARTNTLGNFLTDVADAIRTKKGSEELIAAEDFDTEIENLPSGADLSEYFNNTITENTTSSTQFELIKKLPDVVVDSSVTSLNHLFSNFKINNAGSQETYPKIICENNVTDMSYMYAPSSNNKTNLPTALDISGLNTENVENMNYMFYCRAGITSLDFSNFDFSNVKKAFAMFYNCSGLQSLDLSLFTGEGITNNDETIRQMFTNCSGLTKVDLSNLNPASSTNTQYMFYGCTNLAEIDLDSWDMSTNITGKQGMFTNCGSSVTNGTKVYVKDQAAQDWILALSSSDRPSAWTTDNVIIAGSEADLRNA